MWHFFHRKSGHPPLIQHTKEETCSCGDVRRHIWSGKPKCHKQWMSNVNNRTTNHAEKLISSDGADPRGLPGKRRKSSPFATFAFAPSSNRKLVFADYASRGFWFERICSNLSESTALKCGRSKFGTESWSCANTDSPNCFCQVFSCLLCLDEDGLMVGNERLFISTPNLCSWRLLDHFFAQINVTLVNSPCALYLDVI